MKRLSALFIFIISLPLFAANNNHYSIFIDAGSSGSRIHVFQYQNVSTLPHITDVFSESTKPGLSSYADQPDQAGASLKKLLDDATVFLKNQQTSLEEIPVNVLATAGMRLVSTEKQEAIFTNITHYLKTNYSFKIGDIKVIDGKMEGVYGWLDINYLLGNFEHGKSTVGSIDMGGASTEIAFATSDKSKKTNEIDIEINHQHYTVFSKTFLGLGQDQARITMLNDADASTCYPQNYAYKQQSVGHYYLAACKTIYGNIIQKNRVLEQLPNMQNEAFIAYSGIYYLYDFLQLDQHAGAVQLTTHIEQTCQLPWEKLQKQYPNVPDKYLSTYCANGAYINELLFGAYQLSSSQLTVTDKLNQKEIDWTLGAALYQVI
ncbi:MAG: hypothetical protein WAW86_03960 [Gammaproteobacteria bacterium]